MSEALAECTASLHFAVDTGARIARLIAVNALSDRPILPPEQLAAAPLIVIDSVDPDQSPHGFRCEEPSADDYRVVPLPAQGTRQPGALVLLTAGGHLAAHQAMNALEAAAGILTAAISHCPKTRTRTAMNTRRVQ
jgi:hypothetical protein